MTMEDGREAQFLHGRERRITTTNLVTKKQHQKKDDLVSFWKALRQLLLDWDNSLDALHATPTVTAKQRRDVSDRLDLLEGALRDILQGDSLTLLDLPVSDVRLLHKECTHRMTHLDKVRQESCPPTKFVFLRYRAAMKKKTILHKTLSESPKAVSPTGGTNVKLGGNAIHDLDNEKILVGNEGRVRIQSKNGNIRFFVPAENSSSSVILQNLQSCWVEISRPYKSIHLKNTRNCHVVILLPVEGAVHVTDCGQLVLTASCHQLRLHESRELQCHVMVGTSPILENCTDVVFYASSENDFVRDAKDFNWLRNGVPSPNFSIVDEISKHDDATSTDVVNSSAGDHINNVSQAIATVREESYDFVKGKTEESDDEL